MSAAVPAVSAADAVTVLNDDPGGWSASIPRPASARTAPVRGSSTTIPPYRAPSATAAASWRSGSIVVTTSLGFRPGFRARMRPGLPGADGAATSLTRAGRPGQRRRDSSSPPWPYFLPAGQPALPVGDRGPLRRAGEPGDERELGSRRVDAVSGRAFREHGPVAGEDPAPPLRARVPGLERLTRPQPRERECRRPGDPERPSQAHERDLELRWIRPNRVVATDTGAVATAGFRHGVPRRAAGHARRAGDVAVLGPNLR